ncbi:MAG: DUF805 domain-containing protein [Rhizobiaceae bacterium]|nr:DUF805 domain-containing protein [Rhizobiaceae bacterium]MCV0407292.1 DUF805 domain-containing protein [Rhizobiaceae bacterium]
MRGEILYYDAERGTGFISGEDGNRYAFARDDLGGQPDPAKGLRVEFEAEGGNAYRLAFPERPSTPEEPSPARRPARVPDVIASTTHPTAPASPPPGSAQTPGLYGYFQLAVSQRYATFRGRARRKEYWSFVLFAVLAVFVAAMVGAFLDLMLFGMSDDRSIFTGVLGGLAWLVLFLPGLAVTVRRIHDIGLTGWFVLVGLIPTIGSLILLVFALIPSQKHANQWGPVPTGAS